MPAGKGAAASSTWAASVANSRRPSGEQPQKSCWAPLRSRAALQALAGLGVWVVGGWGGGVGDGGGGRVESGEPRGEGSPDAPSPRVHDGKRKGPFNARQRGCGGAHGRPVKCAQQGQRAGPERNNSSSSSERTHSERAPPRPTAWQSLQQEEVCACGWGGGGVGGRASV